MGLDVSGEAATVMMQLISTRKSCVN